MTNRIMAVYDVDPFYADRFADFVNQKEKVPFTVMAFTTLERLKNYAMEHEIELLLINSTVPKEEIDGLGAARVPSHWRASSSSVMPCAARAWSPMRALQASTCRRAIAPSSPGWAGRTERSGALLTGP